MERGQSLAPLAPAGPPAVLNHAAGDRPIEPRAESASAGPLLGWTPRSHRLGCYVHLPFCAERCGYCSFNTAPYAPAAMNRLLAALLGEIDLVAGAPWGHSIGLRSVFFGGGTPSLATADELGAILGRLRDRLSIETAAEITVECNPESSPPDRLAGYRRAGVNRISLGVQSLDDRILPALDRRHTAADARKAFDAARTAGFDNISVDLIYGLPGLDLTIWEATMREVIAWQPDHLSAYALSLDEGSLWHSTGVAGLPGEDVVAAQYRRLTELAGQAGFEHYEVSNYARPGHRSAHNQIYWRAEEYLGLGPGASGYLGDVRYTDVRPVERYAGLVERGHLPIGTHELLTTRQRLAERLILGLRTRDGVPHDWLDARLAIEEGRLPAVLLAWRERGLLTEDGNRLALTEAGFLLSDALFVELL